VAPIFDIFREAREFAMKMINGFGFLLLLTYGVFQPISCQAARASSNPLMDSSESTQLQYWTFDPMVVSTLGNEGVKLSIQADNLTASAAIFLEDGRVKQLIDGGSGKFSIELTHDEALVGEYWKYAGRNYVGHLDLNDGNTYHIWVNIDDGSIPEVEVMDLDAAVRMSPRIANFQIPHETPAQLDIESITRLFYKYFPDEFDFINVVSTKASLLASHFTNVKNTTQGLGLEVFDHTADYGSSGRLEGVVRITNFSHFDLAGRKYLRMLGYNWMNYSEHPVLSGATPHWPISTLASGVMGYHDQEKDGYGWFPYTFEQKLVGFPPGTWEGDYYLKPILTPPMYNSMERYLMGLIPASRVSGYLVLQHQRQAVCVLCEVKGPLIYYDPTSLLNALGPRIPDVTEARKRFKTATIVVSSDRLLSNQEIRHFDYMAARGEATGQLPSSFDDTILGSTHTFQSATRGAGSLDGKIAGNFVTGINQGHSGAWFWPTTSGQGQFIDVEPNSQFMFIGWFTYTGADSDRPNEQQWYTAQGNYSGNTAVLDLYETLGGKFRDPRKVTTTKVGTVMLEFDDCQNGAMSYQFDAGGPTGEFPLVRVIPGSENWCQDLEVSSLEAVDINHGIDGAWFDPKTPGQGFHFDVHTDAAGEKFMFVSWFTYGDDTASGQRWLTAQGNFAGSVAAIDVYETTGGSFDDPKYVQTVKVGTMNIGFADCETAELSYVLDDGLEGSIDITRVVPGGQALCEEFAGLD
jgi:hypothetical protein